MYPSVAKGHETVVFDFDGTLAEDTWPSPIIGKPIERGIRMLKHYQDQGFCIVIYTARPQSHERWIRQWLHDYELDAIVYNIICGKPIAGLYVDDRAFRFEHDPAVEELKYDNER